MDGHTVRVAPTADLSTDEIAAIRALLWSAFDSADPDERFTEDDWQHSVGGAHFLAEAAGMIVAHASVVEREIHVGTVALRTGYVEAVATSPSHQGRGYGRAVMTAVTAFVREQFEFGALGTDLFDFYARFGWHPWLGETWVRTPEGPRRTPDEDGYVLVLETPTTPSLDPFAPISCEWRPGDAW